MVNNIRYHDYNDSLWFESDNLGHCDIDKNCECSFQITTGSGFYKTEYTFYTTIDELKEIIKLYENRLKGNKNE